MPIWYDSKKLEFYRDHWNYLKVTVRKFNPSIEEFYHLKSIFDRRHALRIILVSSKLLLRGSIDLTAVKQPAPCGNSSTVAQAYCDSKLCLALLARSLKLQHPGIRVFSVSPGWCRTNLGRKDGIPWITMPLLALPLLLFSVSASEGCDSIVFCAYTDRLPSGQFIRNREQARKHISSLHTWSFCVIYCCINRIQN